MGRKALPKKLPTEYREQFIRLWNMGLSYKEMSIYLPFSPTKIYSFGCDLKKEGIIGERPKGRKRTGKPQLIIEAYTNGEHDVEVLAARFDVSVNTVYRYLVPLGRQHTFGARRKGLIEDYLKSDKTRGTIARLASLYGVSRQYAHEVIKQMKKKAK